jgi:signal recognition particle receptor subunit beta
MQGVVFIVGSRDINRVGESKDYENSARDKLSHILAKDELRNNAIIVFANKQDVHSAMLVHEITERRPRILPSPPTT